MIDLSLIQKHKTPTWSYLFHFNAITTYSNLIDMLYLRAIKRFRLHSLHGSSQPHQEQPVLQLFFRIDVAPSPLDWSERKAFK